MTELVNLKTMTATPRGDMRVFCRDQLHVLFSHDMHHCTSRIDYISQFQSIIYGTLCLLETYHIIIDESSFLRYKSDVTDADMN